MGVGFACTRQNQNKFSIRFAHEQTAARSRAGSKTSIVAAGSLSDVKLFRACSILWYIYIYIYICVYVCVYIYVYLCVYMYIQVGRYMYIYGYTYIYIQGHRERGLIYRWMSHDGYMYMQCIYIWIEREIDR